MSQLDDRSLIFRMGADLYGVPLLQVMEVIKTPKPVMVPTTVSHFKGIINLRGQIVSVVDLRQCMGIRSPLAGGFALLLPCGQGQVGAVIDEIVKVQSISDSLISVNPPSQGRVPAHHLLGIARDGEALIQLVDLNALLSQQNYQESA
jgi:purine-binding chemotaxis protein CheW